MTRKRSDRANDLEEHFKDTVAHQIKGGDYWRKKDLEEAFQEALDNTTPEEPGDPRDEKVANRGPEWI